MSEQPVNNTEFVIHWPSVLQVVFSLIGALTLWILAAALGMMIFNDALIAGGTGAESFTLLLMASGVAFAGILLLLQQPFNIGDTIEVSGHRGRVQTVELRDTQLLTMDGLHVSIPNGDVFTDAVINFSRSERRRVEVNLGVAYDSDPERVREIATEAVRRLDGLLSDPPPQVFFHTFGASSVDLRLDYWVDINQTSFDEAVDQGVAAVKDAFEKASIDIPYPVQTVNLIK